jgi:hypothetical protein
MIVEKNEAAKAFNDASKIEISLTPPLYGLSIRILTGFGY